ncbi:Atrial natriuretic peptide receptor 1 [Hypsibius exemplaris]|uniref:guanylate cyclase n=1 Tax=Hypsibius exemplaris TaxID=2072580 RepID=A0A9X6RN69_HYPEX|nr:Atrial natriuretic peptide receptor 1 [Hypsibius exemplaris]
MAESISSTADIAKIIGANESSENKTVLTVCITLEQDSYFVTSYDRVAAAIDLAIANANSFILPASVRIRPLFIDAGPSCSQVQYSVARNVLKLLRKGTTCDVYLGPGCATTAVSLYPIAEEYNVPILGCPSAGVAALSLNTTRTRYPLLIRVAFGYNDFGVFVRAFLDRYNYSHTTIFRDDSYQFYAFMSNFMVTNYRNFNRVLLANVLEIGFTGNGLTMDKRRQLLEQAQNHSRVVFLLTHAATVRQFMIDAHDMRLTQGDFVFIAVELYTLTYWGHVKYQKGDQDDRKARLAFRSLMVISFSESSGSILDDTLATNVKIIAKDRYNYTFKALEKPDPVILAFYEGLVLYAQEVTNMMKRNLNYRDGAALTKRIFGASYDGITGAINIGGLNGERKRDFEMKTFDAATGSFQLAMQLMQIYNNPNKSYDFVPASEKLWFTSDGLFPPDEPQCGFQSDKCNDDNSLPTGTIAAIVVVPVLALLAMSVAAVFGALKLRSLRKDYNPDWWKIMSDDLVVKQNRTGSGTMSKKTLNSQSTAGSALTGFSAYNCDILASYKNNLVALTDVSALQRIPTSDIVSKLNLLKNATHPNLQRFVGIGLSSNGHCQYVVAETCPKGSLTDILNYSTLKLDWSFKNSLIKDIVFGMTYLHTSPMISHGNLTSYTCLIDTRFTLKISDFGLPFFRPPADLLAYPRKLENHENIERLLWRAPELLRQIMPAAGTQKGDVYSFAIILQQIILRSGAFELPNDPLEMSDREILNEVVAANIPPVRPRVPRSSCSNELYELMERCWEEIPVERPTFPKIKERLKRVIGDHGDNIVDVLFKRMEQYAMDLEIKVAEKTQQFMDEKNRSEQLLGQLLPKSVAAALTRGEHVDPEAYDSVTIFFSDIVGFTTIAATGTPMWVVSLLNSLYTLFDSVIETFDVYKVETIGDAYMVSTFQPPLKSNPALGLC